MCAVTLIWHPYYLNLWVWGLTNKVIAALQDYDRAVSYLDGILNVQPNNHQVCELKKEISARMRKGELIQSYYSYYRVSFASQSCLQ